MATHGPSETKSRTNSATDAERTLDELDEFITLLRATVIGVESQKVDRQTRFSGRYTEGAFG